MRVSAQERDEVVRLLVEDVVATLGPAYEPLADVLVIRRAKELLVFVNGLQAFIQQLVDDVQQEFHDTRVDVSWPRCPRHPHHPLWFVDAHWTCTLDQQAIAKLGELNGGPAERV